MRIGWILVGGRNVASARLLGINVHEWLVTKGETESMILSSPSDYDIDLKMDKVPEGFDVVVFQKVCQGDAPRIVAQLQARGTKVVYIVDDLFPEFINMTRMVDVNVVSSGAELMGEYVKRWCGKDPVMLWEAYETPRDMYKKDYEAQLIKVVWFGTMGHINQALAIEPACKSLGYKYEIISAAYPATKKWSLDTVWKDVLECDIVVMPYLGELPDVEQAKGTNRLIQSMALGMPVVTSPYRAYLPIVRQGVTGFVTYNNNLQEWYDYLSFMRDWKIRERVGTAARLQVSEKYNIDTIGQEWLNFFKSLEG